MLNYWMQLKPRERIIIAIASVVLLVLMLYLLLLEPLILKEQTLTERVARQKEEVQWLKSAALEVKQLQPGNKTSGSARKQGESLLVVVDRTAKESNLGDSMKRVEPDGSDRVRVWVEDAAFDDIAKWLVRVQKQYQLTIESAVFDQTENTGKVNARLVFLGGVE